jgi:hypothetical protein
MNNGFVMRNNHLAIFRVLTFLFLGGLSAHIAIAQPKLVIREGLDFEYGRVTEGERPTHSLTILNAGTEALYIQNITVKCECSSTWLHKKNIPPGDSTTLDVMLRSDGMQGIVHKNLSIVSNDRSQPVVLVNFSAEVISFVQLTPSALQFDSEEAFNMTPKLLYVTNLDTMPVKILSARDGRFLVETVLAETEILPGKKTAIVCTPKPVGEQSQKGVLELLFDHPRQPKVRLNYFIQGKPSNSVK